MQTITAEHLHALLGSPDRDAALVVIGGRVTVVPYTAAQQGDPGDLVMITTREAVIAELDTGANNEQLERLAERLDIAFDNVGG